MNNVIERGKAIVEVKNEVKVNNRNAYFKEIALSRLGETKVNNVGSRMWIVGYTSAMDMAVQFMDEFVVNGVTYRHFCNGAVRNPNDISVHGHGCVGVGDYKVSIDGNLTRQYQTWVSMIKRCYSSNSKKKNPTYTECIVSDAWLNFQVFATWYDENYYEVAGEATAIDKDILLKRNKVYSASTCVFVPQAVNNLFTKNDASRGNYPLGVSRHKPGSKYQSDCRNGGGEGQYLGLYSTPEEAFEVYRKFKEERIKQVAESYKGIIPEKLYRALISYEVEIND